MEDCDSLGIKMVVKMLSNFGAEKPYSKPEMASQGSERSENGLVWTGQSSHSQVRS